MQLVNIDAIAISKDRYDQRETYCDFRRRDGDHEKDKDVTVKIAPLLREGDKGEIGGV
jgi:hypothetical protein